MQKTIAILGASADRSKFSNKAVRAYASKGWDVYPVNPRGGQIENLQVYDSLEAIPVAIDRLSVYLPPPAGVKMLPAIAAVGADEIYINPGAESDELVEEARRLGLELILECSIVEIGARPSAFPD